MSGWWTAAAQGRVVDLWRSRGLGGVNEPVRAKLRQLWPDLADALDALAKADRDGPPPCQSMLDADLRCQLAWGHPKPHRWESHDGSVQWNHD